MVALGCEATAYLNVSGGAQVASKGRQPPEDRITLPLNTCIRLLKQTRRSVDVQCTYAPVDWQLTLVNSSKICQTSARLDAGPKLHSDMVVATGHSSQSIAAGQRSKRSPTQPRVRGWEQLRVLHAGGRPARLNPNGSR